MSLLKQSRDITVEMYKDTGLYNGIQIIHLRNGINRAIDISIYHNPKIHHRVMYITYDCIWIIKGKFFRNGDNIINLRTELINKIKIIVNNEILSDTTKIKILTFFYSYIHDTYWCFLQA